MLFTEGSRRGSGLTPVLAWRGVGLEDAIVAVCVAVVHDVALVIHRMIIIDDALRRETITLCHIVLKEKDASALVLR